MCGIFGYANYNVDRSRGQIIDTLVEGLQKLEYRGYDSAGIGIDGEKDFDENSPVKEIALYRQVGKVSKLKAEIANHHPDTSEVFHKHVGIAHTRWATHGGVTQANCHHSLLMTETSSLWFTTELLPTTESSKLSLKVWDTRSGQIQTPRL